MPGCGTPLNLADCCHRLSDLSLCPFLSENGVAALALNHKKDSCCSYFPALTGCTIRHNREGGRERETFLSCTNISND